MIRRLAAALSLALSVGACGERTETTPDPAPPPPAVAATTTTAESKATPSPTLEAIRARGYVSCGVHPGLPGFAYPDAGSAERRFRNEEPGYIYSRFTNPTVDMFEQRLAALEGAEAAIATSTGMAAISTLAMTLCSAGDHIVTSGSVFGSTLNVFDEPDRRVAKPPIPTGAVDARRA